jgi:glycosyltransferase involved in cell wall biosynthesis
MRVALIIYGGLDTVSGGYLYDRQLVAHLRGMGDEVDVISLPWRDYAAHLGDNACAEQLARRVRGADVVLEDELNHPSLIALNRMLCGVAPIVSIVHHLRVSEAHPAALARAHALVERAYLRTCDGFVFNSHTTRDAVEMLMGAPRPHVVAYPAGDRFALRPVESGKPDGPLLFVGNVIERKGLHTLVQALALTEPGVTLSIAGRDDVDPAYSARIRHMIETLGLTQRARWLGYLEDQSLADVYAASSALVMPSQYEGFGIAALEAMGFGLPVIASTEGGAREFVSHGGNGFLIAPGDVPALARHIHALRDRATRARLSQAARARFAAHPGWRESGAAIRAFLVRMIERRSRAAPSR